MIAKRFLVRFLSLASLMLFATMLWAQDYDEDYYKDQLTKMVEVENPVYKPVISIGAGIINFLGDVKTPGASAIRGEYGYKANISTFVGNKNFYRLNFFFMFGNLSGHDFEISRAMQSDITKLKLDDDLLPIYHNSAFRTEFFEFGINMEYGFGHWLGMSRRFRPFVSLGLSPLQFTPKGETHLGRKEDKQYFYFWDDGTIRNLPYTDADAWRATTIKFDNDWEDNLVTSDYHEIGKFPTTTLVVPMEIGFDMFLSYRVNFRVSTSLHYTFSDLLDNYNKKVAQRYGIVSKGGNDMFMFTSASFNFDLFSDPQMKRIDMLFADLDWDDGMYEVMFADQDMDGVYDRLDECPDTPIRVPVDSLGCPFDTDGDGVPDFMDDESDTPPGTIVDDRGVQIKPEVLAQMFEKPTAVRREEAQVIPVAPIWTRNITFAPGVIPQKFRMVDTDGDGYISFFELLKAIEQFFDGTLNMNIEDIYELNNFFFSQ